MFIKTIKYKYFIYIPYMFRFRKNPFSPLRRQIVRRRQRRPINRRILTRIRIRIHRKITNLLIEFDKIS